MPIFFLLLRKYVIFPLFGYRKIISYLLCVVLLIVTVVFCDLFALKFFKNQASKVESGMLESSNTPRSNAVGLGNRN